MELSASNSIPFKSKKPLLSTTPKKPPQPPPESSVATPEKSNPPPRIRNQNFALSVSDVRRTALQLQKKPGVSGSDLSVRVPEKIQRRIAEKSKGSEKSGPSLPEEYEMLGEFFNAMVNSIRLFRLKRSSATLTKLSRNIESLTDRRFTLHHLAQLKHLMPEVIMVKKIRVQDKETNCMKEELLVTLELDALEHVDKNAKGPVGFSHLKAIFRSRIADYFATHPEGDNIPEGQLPYLFYKGKQDPESSVKETPVSMAVSHIAPTFKRRFSSTLTALVSESSSPAKPSSSSVLETPVKEAASTELEDESLNKVTDVASTPAKLDSSTPVKLDSSTPAKLASTPARLMAATPTGRPPKRALMMTPDHEATNLPLKSAKRRSLRFDESHGDIEDQPSQVGSTDTSDILSVLPDDLFHSLMEKDRKIREEQDPVVSQARRRQQLMAGVPKLFDIIHLLFQSSGRSVFTKEELVYKVVAGHMDVIDKREVEEQLKLLQEVAPEYISEQSCADRTILLRRNRSSCPDSIRAKLLQAK